MSNRAIIVTAIGVAILAFFFVGGFVVNNSANAIDNVHWQGAPLPPCFVSAQLCGGHWLGTDAIGRDLLARLIVGGAVTLGWSLVVLICELILVAVTVRAVEFGGRPLRYAVFRIADAVSAIPPWPVLVLAVLFRHRLSLFTVAALIAPVAIRLALASPAASTLADRAARDWQRIVMLMATIDFFGYGAMPPTPSWGNMLWDAQANFQIAWWSATFPAVAITLTVLTIELCRRSFGAARRAHDQHGNLSAA